MELQHTPGKKVSPCVDLTPMVDLGFLLITFFMLVSSFSQPKAMDIMKPIDDGEEAPYPVSKTATILICPNDRLYGYSLPDVITSMDDILIDTLNYSSKSLRKFIQQKQDYVQSIYGDRDQLFVIIKPMQDARLDRVVDVLDEILINQIQRYAIVEEMNGVDSLLIDQ